jgi:hypothetical protein
MARATIILSDGAAPGEVDVRITFDPAYTDGSAAHEAAAAIAANLADDREEKAQ